jgi:hypothetical protein
MTYIVSCAEGDAQNNESANTANGALRMARSFKAHGHGDVSILTPPGLSFTLCEFERLLQNKTWGDDI